MGILLGQFTQEIYGLICLEEFLSELIDLVLEHLDLPDFGVIISDRLIRDLAGLTCILHGADILFDVGIARVQTGDHQAIAVASETLLNKASQLGVSVGYIGR